MEQVIRNSAAAAVGLATAELILALQKEFPSIRLIPCEPIEGEDIHLWAYLPMQAEEQITVQDRIVAIEHRVQAKYDVQTVVVAMPESAWGGLGELWFNKWVEKVNSWSPTMVVFKVEGKAELVNGEIVEMPPSGDDPGFASGEIFVSLHH